MKDLATERSEVGVNRLTLKQWVLGIIMFVNLAACCEFELIPAVLLRPCLKDSCHLGVEKATRAKFANVVWMFLTVHWCQCTSSPEVTKVSDVDRTKSSKFPGHLWRFWLSFSGADSWARCRCWCSMGGSGLGASAACPRGGLLPYLAVPLLWENGGHAHGFPCISGSVVNWIMQDIGRPGFSCFPFIKRVNPCFCCPWEVSQPWSSSHLPLLLGPFSRGVGRKCLNRFRRKREADLYLPFSSAIYKGRWCYNIARKQSSGHLCILSGTGRVFFREQQRKVSRHMSKSSTRAHALVCFRLCLGTVLSIFAFLRQRCLTAEF